MPISLIAALSENNVIGKDNKLPWHLPEDLKYFKMKTLGKPVIMGRKTLASMNYKPLKERKNIVLTRSDDFTIEGCFIVHSIDEALLEAKENEEEVMVIGGSEIFKLFLPMATRLYLTRVHQTLEGDSFFPTISWSEWEKISEEAHPQFSFLIYDKKQPK